MTASTYDPADIVERWAIEKLVPYARNARTHSDDQVSQIAASIKEWGWTTPVLVDETGSVIAGHGRLLAAQRLQMPDVPVMVAKGWSDAKKRAYVIADNKLALNAGWDDAMLAIEIAELEESGFDIDLLGFDKDEFAEIMAEIGDGDGEDVGRPPGKLSDKFMLAPFTVLNAREGWWQDRKRAWLALGIKSELGRGDNLLNMSEAANRHQTGGKAYPTEAERKKAGKKNKYGKCLETGIGEKYGREEVTGTSIFDPVLCEIAYRWFSPEGATILDPFAGGSVRGVVASKLGRQYIGHELSQQQVEANRNQGSKICGDDPASPVWIVGDSRTIDKTCADVAADMIFSCPPYANLEVYSDDPKDLSTMPYADFLQIYREIIAKACARLKPDRFACFVVGDVRDKRGNYYNFVGDTVQAFKDAGMNYYNEAILVTAVGSLPIRAGRQFSSGRKLGKTHQNILVFVKGDGKQAAAACGTIEIGDDILAPYIEEMTGEDGGALENDDRAFDQIAAELQTKNA